MYNSRFTKHHLLIQNYKDRGVFFFPEQTYFGGHGYAKIKKVLNNKNVNIEKLFLLRPKTIFQFCI